MDLMPENLFLDLLDDSRGCCIFSSLCRFCKNSKAKCYVQERLFVGWCNFYLRFANCEIKSLIELWDWTCFLALLDGLSRERRLLRYCSDESYNEKVTHENWDIVQEYLIKENVVKSVLAGGKPLIVRKKFIYWLTEILWSLIFRHYFDYSTVKMSRRSAIDYHKATLSLLKWIKVKLPHCRLNNLTTDLKNGVILCHLINSIEPNCIDPSVFTEILYPEDVVTFAIEAAKEVLGIPALISASDIYDCKADEKSLITYLALFRSADRMLMKGIRPISARPRGRYAFHKDGAKVKQQNSRVDDSIAYGFGIRHGEVGKPTEFVVHLSERQTSDLHISIKCTPDDDEDARVNAEPNLKLIGDSCYIISYTPVMSGHYEISILCGNKHIKNSPFKIKVAQPSIEFKCYTDPDHKLSIEPAKPTMDSDYLIFCDDLSHNFSNTDSESVIDKNVYRPESLSTVDSGIDNALFSDGLQSEFQSGAENSERGSSISTQATSPSIVSKGGSQCSIVSEFDFFEAFGSGLESGEVGVLSHFEVRTPNGSNGPLSVLITCPAVSIPTPYVNTRADGDQLIHDVMFLPTEPGIYEIELKWGKKIIVCSPYSVVVNEAGNTPSKQATVNLEDFFNDGIRLEKKAVLYYSSTSTDKRHARRRHFLESILQREIPNLHLDSIAIDVEMPPKERRKILSQIHTDTRKGNLPFVFVDKKFLGDFETLVGKHRNGELKQYLKEKFEYYSMDESNLLVDLKTLGQIKATLEEIKSSRFT
eukprot:gene13231-4051_t